MPSSLIWPNRHNPMQMWLLAQLATTPSVFRSSKNTQAWVDAGFSQAAAEQYLNGIEESLNSPNMAADLRIPKSQQYIQVELDRILSLYIAGDLTTDEAAQQLYDSWEAITEAEGRDAQLTFYKATLGAQ